MPTILTPNNPVINLFNTGYAFEGIDGQLWVFNSFLGVHVTGSPIKQVFMSKTGCSIVRWIIPTEEVTLASCYEKNRLLLMAGKEYSESDPMCSLGVEPLAVARIDVSDNYLNTGTKLLVTFEVESQRPNKIHMFTGGELVASTEVFGKSMRSLLFDITKDPFTVAIRPAKNDLFIYSVRIEIL